MVVVQQCLGEGHLPWAQRGKLQARASLAAPIFRAGHRSVNLGDGLASRLNFDRLPRCELPWFAADSRLSKLWCRSRLWWSRALRFCTECTTRSASIRETRNDIRLKEDFIPQIPSLHFAEEKLKHELADIKANRLDCEASMPLTAKLPTSFAQINDHARESGSATTHFEPQAEHAMQLLHRVPV